MDHSADVALLVDEGGDDFGDYVLELLRLEGLSPTRLPLESLDLERTPGSLPDRVVLASDLPLTAAEIAALHAHAESGARLVFLFPHPAVAAVFGFTPAYRTSVEGRIRARFPGGSDRSFPLHAALRHYRPPEGAEILAVWEDSSPGTSHRSDSPAPDEAAIIRSSVGRGEAIFVLYDLPRNIAATRQGDSRRHGLHGNLVAPGWRTADLFAGFLDTDLALIPGADLQCHLLRHRLAAPLAGEGIGVPFLWYFPDDAPTVLLLTSDDDWSTQEHFRMLHDALRRYGARITWYLVEGTVVTSEERMQWAEEGDSFSIHPVHSEPLRRTWRETVRRHHASFTRRFGTEPGRSIRNHALAWIGDLSGAMWNYEAGFAWDSNYMTCPPLTRHYMTGGGLPLPLVSGNGTVLPIWQQPFQYSDETVLAAGGFEFSLKLSEAEALEVITEAIRDNAEAYHSLIGVNIHPVSFATYSAGLWEGMLAESERLSIPRIGLEEFAVFWELRRKVRVMRETSPKSPAWRVGTPGDCSHLSLRVASPPGTRFAWDGRPAAVSWPAIHGVRHASVRLPDRAGEWRLTVERDR